MEVHNANLMGVEFLIKVGNYLNNNEYLEQASKCLSFSMSELKSDGSLNYWGHNYSNSNEQDLYHSGFEIRSLIEIYNVTNDEILFKTIKKYLKFWVNNFFTSDFKPGFIKNKFNIIEVHSCAEAIICSIKAFESGFMDKETCLNICTETFYYSEKYLWKNVDDNLGYYAWMFDFKKSKGKLDIPLLRWGESWMLYALTLFLNLLNSKDEAVI
jgi:rhamnogalacturonyl hydrolase YesR